MSPEMKTALGGYEVCAARIDQLKHRAIQGDATAALVLVDAAIYAVRSVQDLWFTPPVYNPFRRPNAHELAERREALGFFLSGKDALPVLHPGDSRQAEMLEAIEAGPFKARKRKNSDTKSLVEQMLVPTFAEIRNRRETPPGCDGEVWALPPLSPNSLDRWADTAVSWLWTKHQAKLTDSASWIYKLANPGRGLKKDQSKRLATLNRKRRRWKRDGGGQMSAVNLTWSQEEEKKIKAMRVTPAHIRNGLKARIVTFLKSNLAR